MKEKYFSLTGKWTKISVFPNPQPSKQTPWEVCLKGIDKQMLIITAFMRNAIEFLPFPTFFACRTLFNITPSNTHLSIDFLPSGLQLNIFVHFRFL
jgi:hypothetical protein